MGQAMADVIDDALREIAGRLIERARSGDSEQLSIPDRIRRLIHGIDAMRSLASGDNRKARRFLGMEADLPPLTLPTPKLQMRLLRLPSQAA